MRTMMAVKWSEDPPSQPTWFLHCYYIEEERIVGAPPVSACESMSFIVSLSKLDQSQQYPQQATEWTSQPARTLWPHFVEGEKRVGPSASFSTTALLFLLIHLSTYSPVSYRYIWLQIENKTWNGWVWQWPELSYDVSITLTNEGEGWVEARIYCLNKLWVGGSGCDGVEEDVVQNVSLDTNFLSGRVMLYGNMGWEIII